MPHEYKAKLVILGATGDGKSSLGNYILNKKGLFRVSDDPESETKETLGYSGVDGAEDIFVIDTPGLQDSRASDKKHIVDMVNYIKGHKDIQAIIIVFNFNQDRFASYLKTMIKIFNDIFQTDDFWYHVGFAFTKYYKGMREKFKAKKEKKIDKYIGMISELVNECKKQGPKKYNTYFLDTDMDEVDDESIEECKRLIGWVSSLSPLDTTQAKEVDDKIRISEKETREIEGPSKWEKNIEYKTFITVERYKNYHYDGTITYTEEVEINRRTEKVVHEKELVNSRFDTKEERLPSQWQGKQETIITKFLRRKILTFNDGSTDEGEWEEYKSPDVQKIDHPKNLTNVKDEYRNFEKYGCKITEQRKLRIYDDGSIEEGEWEEISRIEIPRPVEQGRTIAKIITEKKCETKKEYQIKTEQKSFQTGIFFKDTHFYTTEKVVPSEKEVNYERTVKYYTDGTINYGEWREVPSTDTNQI